VTPVHPVGPAAEGAAGNSLVIPGIRGSLPAALAANLSPEIDPPGARFAVRDLFRIAEWQDRVPWLEFRDGVEIHRLYGDGITGPTAALIRFRTGGYVPLHEHPGYEHIIVLSGSQRDDRGTANAGTLLVSAPGTRHEIASDSGCIVLAIYEKPVRFLADTPSE
jgi:quercetin dioxygenase-like cupin family protein